MTDRHYIGDHCEPDGHADHMLRWLRGAMPNAAYFSLFRRIRDAST